MKDERSKKIIDAIAAGMLALYQGRPVATPSQLAYITGSAYGTIRNAIFFSNVRKYKLVGDVYYGDAEDLAKHFDHARPGRKPSK